MTLHPTYKRLTYRAAASFALLVVFGLLASGSVLSNTAEASILLPENSALNVDPEDVIAGLDQQSATESGTSSKQSHPLVVVEQPPVGPERTTDLALQVAALAMQSDSSTTGTSSSSGSSASGSGASLYAGAAVILPDNLQASRFVGELSLLLPDAPVNKLLRPPKV